ncbi:hypothetical protein E4U14_003835 [Claviceps sp. LM454 group G7]|nr:hypothetical protein E4U14_003835 [Claviceps sp. LM454 group G7]
MTSNATGQPPFNGPPRPGEQRQPGAGGPVYLTRSQWFNWLARNNPLYRGVVIDPDRLQQLPVDGDVSDQLTLYRLNKKRVIPQPQTMTAPVTNSASHGTPDGCGRVQGTDSPRTRRALNSADPASTSVTKHTTASSVPRTVRGDLTRLAGGCIRFTIHCIASSLPSRPFSEHSVFGLIGLASGCLQSITNYIPCRATCHAYHEHQTDAD